jgi:hypothetical protein
VTNTGTARWIETFFENGLPDSAHIRRRMVLTSMPPRPGLGSRRAAATMVDMVMRVWQLL